MIAVRQQPTCIWATRLRREAEQESNRREQYFEMHGLHTLSAFGRETCRRRAWYSRGTMSRPAYGQRACVVYASRVVFRPPAVNRRPIREGTALSSVQHLVVCIVV